MKHASKASGTGEVSFSSHDKAATIATFTTAGSYVLRLTVSDSELTASDEVEVTVNPPENLPPSVNAGQDQTVTLPNSANLNGTASDDGLPIGGALTVAWNKTSGPGMVSFASPNSAATSASFSEAGTYVLRLTATDTELAASDDVTITVNPAAVNQAPVVNAGQDQTVTLPDAATLSGTVTDDGLPSGSTLTINWSKVSGPGTATFSSSNQASTTASFSVSGIYQLRLTASDAQLSTSDDVTVTVNPAGPANQAPTVNAGADQVVIFENNTLKNGGGEGTSVSGWTIGSGSWSQVSTNNFFPPAFNGQFYFSGGGPVGENEFRQDINVTAFASTIEAGAQKFAFEGYARLSNFSGVQPIAARMVVEYRDAANAAVLASFDSGALSPYQNWVRASNTATAPAGARWIRVKLIAVNNTTGIFTNFAFFDAVSVRPVLGSQIDLQATAADDGLPAGSVLSATWSKVSGPGEVAFGNANSLITTASFSQLGVYALRLAVTDSNLTSVDDLTVYVDQAPIVDAGPDQVIALPLNSVNLVGSVADEGIPAGVALSVSWSKVLGPGAVTFSNPNSATTAASFAATGTYVLRLTASDSLLTASDDVTVTVTPQNQAPSVNAGTDQTATLVSKTVSFFFNDLVRFNAAASSPPVVIAFDDLPAGTDITGTVISGVTFDLGNTPSPSSRLIVVRGADTFTPGQNPNSTIINRLIPSSGENLLSPGGTELAPGPNSALENDDLKLTFNQPVAAVGLDILFQSLDSDSAVSITVLDQNGSTILSNNVIPTGTTAPGGAPSGNAFVGIISSLANISTIIINDYDGNAVFPDSNIGFDTIRIKSIVAPSAFINLTGTASDDGLPLGSALNVQWSKTSGPGEVNFTNSNQSATSAAVSEPGVYTLKLTASDSQLSSSDEAIVTINLGNAPPSVNAGPDQTITLPADSVSLSGTVSDDGLPAGSTLTVNWSKASGPGAVTFSNPTDATTSAAFSQSGAYVLRLTAADGEIAGGDEVIIVVNEAVNQAPVVNAGADQTITLPTNSVSLNATVADDGLPTGSALAISWSKVSGPGAVTFSNPNSTTTTAAFSEAGTYVLRLSASDSLLTGSDEVTVTVNAAVPVNQPPVVNAGTDQSITLPSTVDLNGAVTDDGLPAGSVLTVAWSKLSGAGAVAFSNPNSAATTASFSEAGVYVLRLTASDSQLTTSDDVTITVNAANPVNQAPAVNAGADQTITLPNSASLNGAVTDDGLPSGSILTVAWSKLSGAGAVAFSNPNSAATTASFSEAGTYVLRLSASDSLLTSSDDVTITVNPPTAANQAPSVNAGTDQTATVGLNLVENPSNEAQLVNGEISKWIEVSGDAWTRAAAGVGDFPESVDGATYFYAGEAESAELRQDIDVSAFAPTIANGTQQFEFKAYLRSLNESQPDVGRVVFEYRDLTNTNALGFLDSGPVSSVTAWTLVQGIRIVPAGTGWIRVRLIAARNSGTTNDAYFDAVSVRALSTAAVKLNGVATDDGLPVGSSLSVNWSKVSGAGEVNFGNADQAATAATFSQPGQYVLRLTASDSEFTTSDDVAVTVNPQNQAPTVNAGTDQSITLPNTAVLNATATDDGFPVGGALTVVWSKASGPGAVTFDNPNQATAAASFSEAGVYVLRLTASDSEFTTSDDVTVTVNPQNQAPAVNAGQDQTINLPNAAALNATVSDDGLPSGGSLMIVWSKVSGAGTVAFLNANATATSATFSETGAYVLRLTASDGELTVSDDVTITVNPALPPPPTVMIASPTDGASITDRADVIGTISNGSWKLEYALNTDETSTDNLEWTTVASGNATVTNGVLGAFDPTMLLNGAYVLRLSAVDDAGQTTAVLISLTAEKNLKIGNFTLSFNDLSVPVAGLPISLTRTYLEFHPFKSF